MRSWEAPCSRPELMLMMTNVLGRRQPRRHRALAMESGPVMPYKEGRCKWAAGKTHNLSAQANTQK